jgi:hypothetical protein
MRSYGDSKTDTTLQPCSPAALATTMQPCMRLATARTTMPPIGGTPQPWRRRPLWWCTLVTSSDIRAIVALATRLTNMKANTALERQR